MPCQVRIFLDLYFQAILEMIDGLAAISLSGVAEPEIVTAPDPEVISHAKSLGRVQKSSHLKSAASRSHPEPINASASCFIAFLHSWTSLQADSMALKITSHFEEFVLEMS